MCWCIRACSFVLDAQSRPALGRPPLWEGPLADHRTTPPRPPSLRSGGRPSPQKGVKLSSSLALTSLHHRFSYARQPSRRRNRQDQELDRHAGVRSIILVEPQLGENIGAGGSVAACRGRSRATACGGLVFRHPVLTAVPKSRPCRHVPARASRTRLDGRAQHSGRLSHRRRQRNTRVPSWRKSWSSCNLFINTYLLRRMSLLLGTIRKCRNAATNVCC